MSYGVILTGTNGLTGQALLNHLLRDPLCHSVHTFSENPLPYHSTKLHEHREKSTTHFPPFQIHQSELGFLLLDDPSLHCRHPITLLFIEKLQKRLNEYHQAGVKRLCLVIPEQKHHHRLVNALKLYAESLLFDAIVLAYPNKIQAEGDCPNLHEDTFVNQLSGYLKGRLSSFKPLWAEQMAPCLLQHLMDTQREDSPRCLKHTQLHAWIADHLCTPQE